MVAIMAKHHRYGDPRKRQAHAERQGHHARTYLITWDIHVRNPREVSIVSEFMIVHSMTDVINAYGWICEQQSDACPDSVTDLPMPRVFAIDGAIRELPESGYNLIEPQANITYIDPRGGGYARPA